MSFSINKTIVDKLGREWQYNDAWGWWQYANNSIGEGTKNRSKFQIHEGENAGHYEYKTLREAMAAA